MRNNKYLGLAVVAERAKEAGDVLAVPEKRLLVVNT
jgi:hypothetical protein